MAKVQIGKWEFEEETLDQQHVQAKRRGNNQTKMEAQAQNVHYDRQTNEIVIKSGESNTNKWQAQLPISESYSRIAARLGYHFGATRSASMDCKLSNSAPSTAARSWAAAVKPVRAKKA